MRESPLAAERSSPISVRRGKSERRSGAMSEKSGRSAAELPGSRERGTHPQPVGVDRGQCAAVDRGSDAVELGAGQDRSGDIVDHSGQFDQLTGGVQGGRPFRT